MSLVATLDMELPEVVARIERGETLLCPRCRSALKPIPETFKPGDRLYAIECPRSRQHYGIILDHADIRNAMRAVWTPGRGPGAEEPDGWT